MQGRAENDGYYRQNNQPADNTDKTVHCVKFAGSDKIKKALTCM